VPVVLRHGLCGALGAAPGRTEGTEPRWLSLELADARVRLLQRFVLHQRGLHQRVERVRRALQSFVDRAHRVGVARRAFQRRQTIEQLVQQLEFLGCHPVPPVPERSALM
jgi:hypothetical protein